MAHLNQRSLFLGWRHYQGTRTIQVAGRSMAPILLPGDHIRVAHTPPSAILAGDIVVAVWKGELIAHRLTAITSDDGRTRFILKGDRSASYESVHEDELLGRVVGGSRDGKDLALDDPVVRGLGRVAARLGRGLFALVGPNHLSGASPDPPSVWTTLIIKSVNRIQGLVVTTILALRRCP